MTGNGAAFRPDIQGLRAVAVILVLAYHLWPDRLTGGFVGVDAFFVISGFLITAHLLEHPPRRSRDLLEFWGRRVRRLLPAAFLVLIVTAIASRFLAPETRWAANAGQIIASALYVQNWVLASNSVDYLAAEDAPTPVQHFWSLSVEEQFYLVWPILILALFWFATRSRIGPSMITRVAMLTVVGLSLYVSITATNAEPASAYFITPTRVWELAAGGLVATLPSLREWRLPTAIVEWVAWFGFGLVVGSGLTFSAATPFPGAAAVAPVLGTALVIVAAADGPTSPTRLLRARPIQHLGDTSYSIYLWHWPLIALWPYAFGPITFAGSLTILGLTIGLATITKVLVEDPFRYAPSFQPLVPTFRFAAVGMLLLSILGSAQLVEAQTRLNEAVAAASTATDPDISATTDWEMTPEPQTDQTIAAESSLGPAESSASDASAAPDVPETPEPTPGPTTCFGAASIIRGFDVCPQDRAGPMVPDPLVAATNRSAAYRDGCWIGAPFTAHTMCQYGSGKVRIALVGNSHAGQWLPTLLVLARRHGWSVTTFLASQCNATNASLAFATAEQVQGCLGYGDWVMDQTRGRAFDLVITAERQSVPTLGDTWGTTLQTAITGYTSYLKQWNRAGTNVLVLQDTPFPGRTLDSVPDCLALHPRNHSACDGTPETWFPINPLYRAATDLALPHISTLPVMRFFCTSGDCPAVIGTVITYFDASHMTATYARSIAPFVDAEIVAALNRGLAQ